MLAAVGNAAAVDGDDGTQSGAAPEVGGGAAAGSVATGGGTGIGAGADDGDSGAGWALTFDTAPGINNPLNTAVTDNSVRERVATSNNADMKTH